MILREKDDNSGWTSSADGTLELRRYYLQNWRADVSAMVEADGTQVERVKYSAYGVPIDLTPGDFNADAAITSQDDTDFQAAQGGAYDVRTDLNMDGNSDFGDYLLFLNEYGTGEAGGRGVLSRPSNANRAGYAGYQHGSELLGTKWHVRHRVLDSELGRWTRRDPLGYTSGTSLTSYVDAQPIRSVDSQGLLKMPCPECGPGKLGPPTFENCWQIAQQIVPPSVSSSPACYAQYLSDVGRCCSVQVWRPDPSEMMACLFKAATDASRCANPAPTIVKVPGPSPRIPLPPVTEGPPEGIPIEDPDWWMDYFCSVEGCGCPGDGETIKGDFAECLELVRCLMGSHGLQAQTVALNCCLLTDPWKKANCIYWSMHSS